MRNCSFSSLSLIHIYAEEQQVLSQYVGWGGLADVFDPNKENWSAEYTQLKVVGNIGSLFILPKGGKGLVNT